MPERGGLVILTSRQMLNYFLINQLAARFDVGMVIYERGGLAKSVAQVARRARRLGWGTAIGQLIYLVWDRLYVRPRSRAKIERLLAGYHLSAPGPRLPQMEVDSVNDETVIHALERIAPAVCVVSGTSLIKAAVLAKAPCFLNIHAGITPRYRGAHGAFWAVYEGRPELAGVTVHLVDTGVDTGSIVAQTAIEIDPRSDTPRTLVAKQYLAGAPLTVQAVEQALAGRLQTTQRSDLESRLWYSPTPSSYWRFRRRLARLAANAE